MSADGDGVDDTGIAPQLVHSLPPRPLTTEEWDVVDSIDGLSDAAPIGFYAHTGAVTHFVIQFDGSTRIIGWNPRRSRWELIVLVDPREGDDGTEERTVKTIEAGGEDAPPSVEFELGDDFGDSVMDFVERYARRAFRDEVAPTLPSELDAATDRQELIDAAVE